MTRSTLITNKELIPHQESVQWVGKGEHVSPVYFQWTGSCRADLEIQTWSERI
ncbi:hypothetical protein [Paenibacillus sp. 1_12]|uniref:hypothetical protein n=1 Tax=Paenibacillus sp. 1_12 TaxID=1566278 RepID=UPI0015A6BF46|nr:hypothetical protein [Paenibacillus sp. 1_12]